MLTLSIIWVVVALAASSLSRSGLSWSLVLMAGLLSGWGAGSLGHHNFLFVIDLGLLFAMMGMRQQINSWWQDVIVVLQIMITVVYLVFTVFSGRAAWLTGAAIDTANLLYLAQLALATCGGLRNSLTNVMFIRRQRRRGNHLPFLPTAWRMT